MQQDSQVDAVGIFVLPLDGNTVQNLGQWTVHVSEPDASFSVQDFDLLNARQLLAKLDNACELALQKSPEQAHLMIVDRALTSAHGRFPFNASISS